MTGPDDEYYEQSPEEMEAHFGPAGPVQVATAWLTALLAEKDYAAVWCLSDPEFRTWRAEEWVQANAQHVALVGRNLAALAEELATVGSQSDLWPAFADVEVNSYGAGLSHVDLDQWGWASRPRPYAPGYEIVLMLPTGGVVSRIEKTTLVRGLQLVMHHTPDGWLVAGSVDALPPRLRQDPSTSP